MFKKSDKETQLDVFSSVSNMLDNSTQKQYSDKNHWHNQFREQVVLRIDEPIFSVLFNSTTGAPNSPIRVLIGMMILKEAFGWSDEQLYEHCRFNLLVRSSLGLFNMNDSLPVESTYYLLRKRIYEHKKQTGEDLMEQVFSTITQGQVKDFEVNGRSIRMDSKLIGSNIAVFSRYEIIHQTLSLFYKSLDTEAKSRLSISESEQLEGFVEEECEKTVYRSTKEELNTRLQTIGILIYRMVQLYGNLRTDRYELLKRVFKEQYSVLKHKKVVLRPKEEISSSSVQSPHDPDSGYSNKQGQNIKGYRANITETCSDNNNLNLITNVLVEKANTADASFVQPAISGSVEVTGQPVEKVYLDGGFHSPANDEYCENIDMVFTGMQGFGSRYDLEMTSDGLMVTDTKTGEVMKATPAKKLKNSREDRWRITTPTGYYYFGQQAIRAAHLRRKLLQRTQQELHKRNNVEATIFQLGYSLKNGKSKYRGLVKQKLWSYFRCLWINFVRILNFTKQICQRTIKSLEIPALEVIFSYFSVLFIRKQPVMSPVLSITIILSIIVNYYV
jgi:hypothetical protein